MSILEYGEGREEGDILMRYIRGRLKRFKTTTIVLTGGLGTGKSYTCLRIAELWYKFNFNKEFPIENVCFDIGEAMKLLTSGKLKKGEIIIIEEAGVNINAKDFQSKVNRFFNFYMQAFRQKQVMVLFNCPVFDMIDKSTRILVNANFITQKIDRKRKLCIVKPFIHQLNQQTGKVYTKYLRVWANGTGYGFRSPIKNMEFSLPSEKLVGEYERKKERFLDQLGDDTYMMVKVHRNKKPLSPFQEKLYDYIQNHPGLTLTAIANHFGKYPGVIQKNLGYMERKGYNVRKYLRKRG